MKTVLKLAGAVLASVFCFAMTIMTAALALHAWRHGDSACTVGAGIMATMSLLTGALYASLAGCIAAEFKRQHHG